MTEVLWGVGLFALAALALVGACGVGAVAQCRVEAVKFLPSDPGQITTYDVADLVGRLKACQAGDAAP